MLLNEEKLSEQAKSMSFQENLSTHAFICNSIKNELNRYATAFSTLGNSKFAESLYAIAKDLDESKNRLIIANQLKLDEEFKNAQSMSGAMLSMALTVCDGKKKNES